MKTTDYHPFRSPQARAEYHALYAERAKAWPVPSETRLIETPAGQTFVRISGRPTDPPLVLLPGSLGTSLTWIPNIAALSAHYRTYALDSIYDFGLSIRRRAIRKPEHLVAWLNEVLAVLVPQGQLRLVGLSYGGWLACQYAVQFPERVHKVVLLSPALTVLPAPASLILRSLLTLTPLPGYRRRFYDWLLQDTVQSGEAGKASVDEAVADWAVAARCFGAMPMVNLTVLKDQELQDFKVPCLYLVGEHEKIYSAQKAVSRLNRVAPQIQTEIFSQAGHDLWFVQAPSVNSRMIEFFADPETELGKKL